MANYSLVINSQFKPFSYAELLAPVHASTEAHQKVEDEYTALSSQAETLRARAEQEALTNPNSNWVKKYNDYAAKLEKSASDLAQYGLQPGVRQQVMQAKKDYFNSVDPAVKAIAQQQKLSDAQYAQNPALRMVYGDMPTIDALIGDMTLKPAAYSGSDIYSQALTSSKAASARNILKTQIERNPQLAGYFNIVNEVGYSAKTLEEMKKIPELAQVIDLVKGQFGNFEGVSEQGKAKLTGEALKGLFDGVAYARNEKLEYDKYQEHQRQFAENARQRAFQASENEKNRNFQRGQYEQAKADAGLNVIGATPDPVKLYGVTVNKEQIDKFEKSGFLTRNKDNKLQASPKSKAQYNAFIQAARDGGISIQQAMNLSNMSASKAQDWIAKNAKDSKKADILTSAFGVRYPYSRSSEEGNLRIAGEYASALDNLYKETGGKSPLVKFGTGENQYYGYQPGNIGNLFAEHNAANPTTTITESTAWRYKIKDSQNEAAINQLIEDLGTKQDVFTKVEYDGSKYSSTGTLKKGDFNSTNYKVLSYQASPKGIVAEILGKGTKAGEHFFIDLPDSESRKRMDKIFQNQAAYQTIYGASPEAADWADFMHKAGVSDLYNVFADMYRENESKPQQFQDAGMALILSQLGQNMFNNEEEE